MSIWKIISKKVAICKCDPISICLIIKVSIGTAKLSDLFWGKDFENVGNDFQNLGEEMKEIFTPAMQYDCCIKYNLIRDA